MSDSLQTNLIADRSLLVRRSKSAYKINFQLKDIDGKLIQPETLNSFDINFKGLGISENVSWSIAIRIRSNTDLSVDAWLFFVLQPHHMGSYLRQVLTTSELRKETAL